MAVLAALGAGAAAASALTNIAGGAVDLFTRKKRREEQWAREDTAYQRKAADLKAAGLSQTLAAGGSGSQANPISTRATQTSQDIGGQVLKSAQAGLAKKEIAVKDSQIALNEAMASKANTEAGNLVLQRPKIGSEGTLLADKATAIPQERAAYNDLGWSYYKDPPNNIVGQVAMALAAFARSTTGLAQKAMEKLQPLVDKLSSISFPNWEERSKWIDDQLSKLPFFGSDKAGIAEILKREPTPPAMNTWQANDRNRNMLPYYD